MCFFEHASFIFLVSDLADEVCEKLVLDIYAVVAKKSIVEFFICCCLALRLEEPQIKLLLARHFLDRIRIVYEELG